MSDSAGQPDAANRSASRVDMAAALAEHGRWLRTVLAARGVERSSLDDSMQAVCSAAIAGAATLKDSTRVGPWLYRIAVVEALQYRRKLGRRRRLTERFAESGVAPCESIDCDPLDWLLAEETQQLVRKALHQLSPQDAEMMLLKYTEDWSYRQLADHLGLTTSAVEARLHRARGRMRAALAQLAPDLAVN